MRLRSHGVLTGVTVLCDCQIHVAQHTSTLWQFNAVNSCSLPRWDLLALPVAISPWSAPVQSYPDAGVNLLSRLNRTPAGKSTYLIAAVLVFAWIVEAFDVGIVSSLMIVLTDLFALEASSKGILGASAAFGVVLGLIPAGRMADKFGRKRLLFWGVAWFGFFTLIGALWQNFAWIVILRFVAGLGEGAVFPIPYMILAEIVRSKKRATSVGYLNGILLAAYFFPGLIGAWAIAQFPIEWAWRVPFIIGGILPLVLLPIIAAVVPESPRWLLARGRVDEVRAFVEKLEREAGIAPDPHFVDDDIAATSRTSTSPSAPKLPWSAVVRPPYLSRSLISWASFGSSNLSFYVILVFFPTIFVSQGLAPSGALLVVAVMALISGVGSAVEGHLADRFGRKPMIMSYALLSAVGIISVGYAESTLQLLIAGLLAAFCGLAANSISKVYIAEQYPTEIRGMGTATGESAARFFGSVLAIYYVPSLLAWLDVRGTLWVVGSAVVLLVLPAALWGRETGGWSLEASGSHAELGAVKKTAPENEHAAPTGVRTL
jgi:putative MFS transporter